MSPCDVDASRAGSWHCHEISYSPTISGWERRGNRLNRLLSCVGISKVLEWFRLFLATMASITQKTVASLRMAERCVYIGSIRFSTCDAGPFNTIRELAGHPLLRYCGSLLRTSSFLGCCLIPGTRFALISSCAVAPLARSCDLSGSLTTVVPKPSIVLSKLPPLTLSGLLN